MRRKAQHPMRQGTHGDLRCHHGDRRPGHGEVRPTVPANPLTAWAPATPPWSSTKPPISQSAARNTRISKTNDNGSGCSADGNLIVESSIYDASCKQLAGGGRLSGQPKKKKQQLQAAYWDAEAHRTPATIARSRRVVAELAGFSIPAGKTFFIVPEDHIGKQYLFSTEKLGVVLVDLQIRRLAAWPRDGEARFSRPAASGHSCGIYSLNDEHINELALMAPVSRMMVRQIQSSSNAGHLHQRHADDFQHGLRLLGREQHQ